MEIIEYKDSLTGLLPCVATIGFFDGVHVGHQYIVSSMCQQARLVGMPSLVVTFDRHPRQVLHTGWHPHMLSTLDEKIGLLSQTDVDYLALLPFDEAMASLPARRFMADVLRRRLNVCWLMMGYDNHFGHRTAGSTEGFDDYVRYGRELGLEVRRFTPMDFDGIRVSSSKVRQMLLAGDVAQACRCLGRPYALSGCVVSGEHIGTGMGFPTANLQPDDADKLIPATGAYAVRVYLEGEPEMDGMMNIGRRPTFDGDHQTLETNIFHFTGNLYGRQMTVKFVSRLRSEMKFDSAKALTEQLATDARHAEEVLKNK